MKTTSPEPPFPCPFCHSSRVALIGGGLVFLHYKCVECAEVWTAMVRLRATLSTAPRRDFADDSNEHGGSRHRTVEQRDWTVKKGALDGRRRNKFWRH